MAAKRTCIFCGGRSPLTLEHVVPEWLTDFFKDIGVTRFDSGTTTPEGETRTWDTMGVDHKVRLVCKTCNNGWMASLEGEAKPVLIPLLLANALPLTISEDDQTLLAMWAYKTALVIGRHLEGHSKGPYKRLPANAYKRFYRSRVPPDRGVRIWTIPVHNPGSGLWWQKTDFSLYHKPFRRGKKTIPGARMDLYLITFVDPPLFRA